MISRTLAEEFNKMAPFKGGLPFSYSRATTLLRCPLQFEWTYRTTGIPRGTPIGNDETKVGSLAHQLLECTVKRSNATEILTPAGGDFENNFRDALARVENDSQRMSLIAVKAPTESALSELYSKASEGGYSMLPERELKFGANGAHIPTLGGCRSERTGLRIGFKGYVDLELKRDGELVIIDYKTEFPSDERRDLVELQMGLYAFCEFEVRPKVERVSTKVVYLKNGEIGDISSYERGEQLMRLRGTVVDWMEEYVSALRNFKAEKRENRYCKYCGFAAACRSFHGRS